MIVVRLQIVCVFSFNSLIVVSLVNLCCVGGGYLCVGFLVVMIITVTRMLTERDLIVCRCYICCDRNCGLNIVLSSVALCILFIMLLVCRP